MIFFTDICILVLGIILWILMVENWALWHWKHLLPVIYFTVNTFHLFHWRIKKKKRKRKLTFCWVPFSQAQVQGVSGNDNLSVFKENKLNQNPRCFCWGIVPRDTWESHPKEAFWRSERDVCLEVSLLPKLYFAQTVQGHSPADPPPLTKVPGSLPAPSTSAPDMILFC